MKQRAVKNTLKLIVGFIISFFFLYLAFRKVHMERLYEVLKQTKATYLIFALCVIFISHWLRAIRHRYLLNPIKEIKHGSLFSALMIGYGANTLLPAHLGEFLRAYIIGKRSGIAGSSVLATIVVERIIDVLSLLILMGFVFLVYPFPEMIRLSAYLTLVFSIGMILFLVWLKLKPHVVIRFLGIITRFLSKRIRDKLINIIDSFQKGIVAFENKRSYPIVFILSIVIWMGYAGLFVFGFYAFNFIEAYDIPIGASLVVLVVTTISILVPSSPGYVGTYHWLCMIALGLFGIPESAALGFAIVIHAVSMIPVAFVGVVFALREGINIVKIGEQDKMSEMVIEG